LFKPRQKTARRLLKKLKTELSCGPEIPLLRLCPKERKSGHHFTVASFTSAKIERQPEDLSAVYKWNKSV
jgi:hypothetical protein